MSLSFISFFQIPIPHITPPMPLKNGEIDNPSVILLEHSLSGYIGPVHSILLQCKKLHQVGIVILPNTRHQHRHQCLGLLRFVRLRAVRHKNCIKNHISPAMGRVGMDWGTGKRRYCLPSNKSGTRSRMSTLQVPRNWLRPEQPTGP